MENATKAFYIAASVLIAVMLMSITVYLFRSGARIGENFEQSQANQSVELFNSKYSAFMKDNNTISDMITLINMAYDNNLKNDNDQVNSIKLLIEINGFNLMLEPNEKLKRNQVFFSTKIYYINTYDLLNLKVGDMKCYAVNNNRETGIAHHFLGGDGTEKLTDSWYDPATNERVFRYYFQYIDATYNETTGKIDYMEFKMQETEDF